MSFSTTPKVQYAYSFNPTGTGNNSHLVNLTHPDGHVTDCATYNDGLDLPADEFGAGEATPGRPV